ncbi:transposase [Methylomonas sp. MO1]|uniref:transposase n=1 Tax=Methylomonas sp. MO1 TaxID=3073619 RepID=UPI0039181FE4
MNVDEGNKLIQSYSVTHAAVHDSQLFDELLDHTSDEDGNKRAVYADSTYRSEVQEQREADTK